MSSKNPDISDKEIKKIVPHHGGPDANPLLTKAILDLNSAVAEIQQKTKSEKHPDKPFISGYGPAIGSEGFYGIPNHEPGSPRK